MKQTKQWFAYLPLDRKGVETYLNDQAEKGWALAVEQDGMTFRVPFQETSRTDLRYHVTCDAYQGEKLAEIVAEKQAQGWRPVATINHFDIYESMPCQEPHSPAQKRSKRLSFYAFRAWLIVLLLAAALLAIAWVNRISLPSEPTWYLSNLGIFLRCTFPLFAVGSIYYLLWLGWQCFSRGERTPKQSGMRLRSGLQVAAGVWLLLALIALLLDLVTNILAFCALVLSRRHSVWLCATPLGQDRDPLFRHLSGTGSDVGHCAAPICNHAHRLPCRGGELRLAQQCQ